MLHCDLRVQWKVASNLRLWDAISEAETPSFCGISGDLAPSTQKSLAIAIVRFWCAKLSTPITQGCSGNSFSNWTHICYTQISGTNKIWNGKVQTNIRTNNSEPFEGTTQKTWRSREKGPESSPELRCENYDGISFIIPKGPSLRYSDDPCENVISFFLQAHFLSKEWFMA